YPGSGCMAAHQLTCSEVGKAKSVGSVMTDFGYDINNQENDVYLPTLLPNACQLHVALHRSNHNKGFGGPLYSYPEAVQDLVQKVTVKARRGAYCANPKSLEADLNKISGSILRRVEAFQWTLTKDGHDYKPGGIGCSGAHGLNEKTGEPCCPIDRTHALKNNQGEELPSRGTLRT